MFVFSSSDSDSCWAFVAGQSSALRCVVHVHAKASVQSGHVHFVQCICTVFFFALYTQKQTGSRSDSPCYSKVHIPKCTCQHSKVYMSILYMYTKKKSPPIRFPMLVQSAHVQSVRVHFGLAPDPIPHASAKWICTYTPKKANRLPIRCPMLKTVGKKRGRRFPMLKILGKKNRAVIPFLIF